MNKESGAAKKRSSGNLMVVSLILMALSCVLFVGTTLAWFTNQTSGGINRIQAGNLEAVLMIGESRYTAMRLETESDTPQGGTGNAVQLCLHKLLPTKDEEGRVTDVAVSDNKEEIWNPDDIFISDVMQVVKASGSVPFRYKLELSIDPKTQTEPVSPPPLKASELIDFYIVDVDTVSELDAGDDPTRIYNYEKIAAYFAEPAEELLAPIWPLAETEDNSPGQAQTPANVFSSEMEEDEEPVHFVILAKLKTGVTLIGEGPDIIENPFNLIVTVRQSEAEFEEPTAEAGGAP